MKQVFVFYMKVTVQSSWLDSNSASVHHTLICWTVLANIASDLEALVLYSGSLFAEFLSHGLTSGLRVPPLTMQQSVRGKEVCFCERPLRH